MSTGVILSFNLRNVVTTAAYCILRSAMNFQAIILIFAVMSDGLVLAASTG